MLIYLRQVYVLLTTLISQPAYCQACNQYLFGEDCSLYCNCDGRVLCDQVTGACPTCAPGYFSDGCQFVELVSKAYSPSVPSYLRDSNDNTCNPDTYAGSVELIQRNPYPLSFFRIVANSRENLLNFTTMLNNGQPCSFERKFKVSDTIVDVTCDVTINLEKLRIEGPIAGSICSIYISGGRNVALYQHTSQSSTSSKHVPGMAVDGELATLLCTKTREETLPPWWLLTYKRPQKLYSVVIRNVDAFKYRLNGFTLQTIHKNGTVICEHIDHTTTEENTYMILVHSQTPVTYVKITQSSRFTGADRVLTLCEVETYGDTFCPNHTYGLYCQHACSCKRTERCHVATGACAKGCQAGYYGYRCVSRCSTNCLTDVCEWATGYCLECKAGFMGDMCDIECSPGLYGPECMDSCSERCEKECDRISGACVCKTEFSGPNCSECSPGYYGLDCANRCSVGCNDVCDPMNGTCLCQERFTGTKCTECRPGYYGPYCVHECSVHCLDTCDPINGTCLCWEEFTGQDYTECSSGHYGRDCVYNCSEGCINTCNNINGNCKCQTKFTGQRCTVCSPGYYGLKCMYNCSTGCQDICNPITGMCRCKDKFIGPLCTGCADSFYGDLCETKCSENCLKQMCHQTYGSCLACDVGYKGQYCENESGLIWLVFPVILALILLLIVVAIRKKNVASETNQNTAL